MTNKEKAIVMAYTGISMLNGEKFSIFLKYIEDICGRPIWTLELADGGVWREIKEKSKDDFLRVCRSENTLDKVLEIIDVETSDPSSGEDGHEPMSYSAGWMACGFTIRDKVEALRGEQDE